MKKIYAISMLFILSLFLLSYSTGNFTADYTGQTGLGQSCAQIGCHEGAGGTSGVDSSRLYVRVLDGSNNDISAYTPGQQYTIEIRFKLNGATRVGFQCPSLFMFSNAKAGSISNTLMPTLVQLFTDGSGREYMSHTSAGNGTAVFSGGYAIWRYRWTAPSTAPDAIIFPCAVNRSNNDNDKTGDSIFIYSRVLQKPTGIEDHYSHSSIRIFPQPAYDFVLLQGIPQGSYSADILNLTGQKIQHTDEVSGQPISVGQLPRGQYILRIYNNKNSYSLLFTRG